MEESTSKEKILKKIRKALIHKSAIDFGAVDFDSDIYTTSNDSPEVLFAQRFSAINGKFAFCEDETDFVSTIASLLNENKWDNVFCKEESIKKLLNKGRIHFSDTEADFIHTNVGITSCEFLVARTGSVVMSSRQASGRRLPAYANYHIVVAYTSQLVYSVKDALNGLKKKYGTNLPSLITTITGPSRTADIEKTLVQGAHGPKEIYVFLIDSGK
ncbi:MAG: lactate utilization protein [Bacteroidia bacterium]|nr:lactate utilization protein [Bacteroidia bacterium]